jgi:hypothetical protein
VKARLRLPGSRWCAPIPSAIAYGCSSPRRCRFTTTSAVAACGASPCQSRSSSAKTRPAHRTSHGLPVLWRIDPQGFEITRIELELGADGDKDVGFTGLSFAADGVLIAAGTTYASLWRIDLRTASASKIASYPLSTPACDPAVLLNARRERGGRMVAVLPAAARQ